MTLFLKLRFSSIFAQQGGPVRAVLTLAGALMDDPHHIFLRKGDTRFFSFEKGPPMRHLQFILVPYLQCHKLLANSRKWFPAETCSPMLYRLFIIRTT